MMIDPPYNREEATGKIRSLVGEQVHRTRTQQLFLTLHLGSASCPAKIREPLDADTRPFREADPAYYGCMGNKR